MKIKAIIMSGGFGARLWPLSRQNFPKQFMQLFDHFSLMQRTIINNSSFGKPTLVFTKEHEQIVRIQVEELGVEADFIIEPLAKNTAAAAITSAIQAKHNGYETVILLPADHYIDNIDKYLGTIKKCLRYVSKFGICTIGIKPDSPNIEYGYIKVQKLLADRIYKATHFVEKPTLLKAQDYLEEGQYFWNSGIFIFNIDFILNQTKLWQKKLFMYAYNALYYSTKYTNHIELALKPYVCIQPMSLDKAIIQNINQMVMVCADFSWQDLGNWDGLWQMQPKDALGNYCKGDVIKVDTNNSYIYSQDKLTVVIGIDDIIIVNTKDALLVVKRSKIDQIKPVILQMANKGRVEV